jgi:broad specificity phosphatase PhoE
VKAVRWWWVRHAPTGANGAVGWTDVGCDLSDGPALDRLAARLPAAPVVTSDLSRARRTADRIAGRRARLAAEPALRELHFGAWEGLPFDLIAERWPEDHDAFWRAPGPARATGGEGFDDLCGRVGAAIDRIQDEIGEGDVIAVAHMGVILAALRRALDLSAPRALSLQIDPLSLTRIDFLPETGGWRVGSVNKRP